MPKPAIAADSLARDAHSDCFTAHVWQVWKNGIAQPSPQVASATGYQGAAMSSGWLGRVQGSEGNALFACERETWDGPILSVACGIVGQNGIKPMTWYRCVGGKLVEGR